MVGDALASWHEAPTMLAVVDTAGGVVCWNAAARRRLSPPEQHGTPDESWSFLIAEPVERARLLDFLCSGEAGCLQLQGGDGWLQLRVESGGGGRVAELRDVTQETAEADQREDRVARLQRLLRLAQQDRQLIAHEIHDGLVQEMTAAQMFLETAAAELRDVQPVTRQALDDALTWLRQSIDDARRLMNGLRPPELESGTVVEAVKSLLDNLPVDMQVEFQANDSLADIDPTIGLSLFRILQESINNARRHSQSKRLRVSLQRGEDEVRAEVRDWGCGFDLSEALGRRFGLKGLTQRAAVFGGVAEIQSEVGQGTCIRVRLPLLGG